MLFILLKMIQVFSVIITKKNLLDGFKKKKKKKIWIGSLVRLAYSKEVQEKI